MPVDNLPTYIPLDEAAATYRLDRETLTGAVENGIIRAVKTPEGGILVAEEDVKLLPVPEPDQQLKGKPIRVTKAAEKYSVNQSSLTRWANAGYIRVIERGPKLLKLDEADVKLAVDVFNRARRETGSFVRAGWILKRTLTQMQAS